VPRSGTDSCAELVLQSTELLLDLFQLLDLLGYRLALQLLATAQFVDLRDELAPPGVGLEELVERLAAPLARDPGPQAVRVASRRPEVDQA
jgi:hypothetical protein